MAPEQEVPTSGVHSQEDNKSSLCSIPAQESGSALVLSALWNLRCRTRPLYLPESVPVRPSPSPQTSNAKTVSWTTGVLIFPYASEGATTQRVRELLHSPHPTSKTRPAAPGHALGMLGLGSVLRPILLCADCTNHEAGVVLARNGGVRMTHQQ